MLVSLRPYQTDAVNAIRDTYRNGRRAPLLVLPTGSGKTVIFCDITERVAAKNKRITILVHRQELLTQTSEHLDRLGIAHGRIATGHSMTGDHVQVASVQTLVRRLGRAVPPDLIVIDECHHANAGSWRKILNAWPGSHVLGVTATPCRMDGSGLGQHAGGYFDALVEGPNIRKLIDLGFLSQPVVYAPPTGVDFSKAHMRAGDFVKSEVNDIVDKPTITGNAIEHYTRICPNAPAIAFCASVAHAEHVSDQFNQAGVPAASLDGTMHYAQRKHRIQSLANGQIRVLTSCDIISEGTDIPVVTAAILMRPTQSTGLYLQQVGRALRVHPNKKYSYILDHVGNCIRHGLPDEEREWSLDGEKKRGKKRAEAGAPIRQCSNCYAVYAFTLQTCPQCGCARDILQREIKQVEGNLVEVTPEQAEAMRKQKRREVGKASTLDDLQKIAKQRGYKPQWAQHVWRARMKKRKQREFIYDY